MLHWTIGYELPVHKVNLVQPQFMTQSTKERVGGLNKVHVGTFNQNSNLWETKQIEKTHVKENNHTHKAIFTWFGNLPTSTELQGFHYKIRRYNSAQEHSQETQFPIHPNSLSPTRQENTILSSYAAARLLGIISNSHSLTYYHKPNIYIYIYVIGRLLQGVTILLVLGFLILLEFGL